MVDIYGNTAAYYEYDPYGNAIQASGSHANINPLRYRGYVYDYETGLYYLQSRYYDPEIGRFINADVFTSTGQGLLGNNMFSYCNNNPVNRCDSQGTLWEIVTAGVIASVVSGIANAISTAINGGNVEECVVAGLIGAGSAAVGFGVAIATGFSPAGNLAARAVASTLCDLGTTYYLNGKLTANDLLATTVDVTFDVGFSHYIYSYTDPIVNSGRTATLARRFSHGVTGF